jgi:hypothetical protein
MVLVAKEAITMNFDTGRFLLMLAILLVPALMSLALFVSVPAALGMLLARPVRDKTQRVAQNVSTHIERSWWGRWMVGIRDVWRNRPRWVDVALIVMTIWYAWTLWNAQIPTKGLATVVIISFIAGFALYMLPTPEERRELQRA